MELYSILDICEMLFLSKSKVIYVIKKLGLTPAERKKYNQYFYTKEQVELIKENNPKHYKSYTNYLIFESKANY
jgi:hypothetical protein